MPLRGTTSHVNGEIYKAAVTRLAPQGVHPSLPSHPNALRDAAGLGVV